MPRKQRFFLPDIPVHAITRGNDRNNVFADDEDKKYYISCLQEASMRYPTAIHAYVLMDNHVHLLMSSCLAENISKFMQHLGRLYVPYFNRKYGHSGTLWEGRFKASIIDDEQYLLSCYRYIELNPVRAGMVDDPRSYQWSSYLVNAVGEESLIIKPHEVYLRLGLNERERAKVYCDGFNLGASLDSVLLKDIREAVQTGTPLGGSQFKEKVEKILSKNVGQAKRGRPSKKSTNL